MLHQPEHRLVIPFSMKSLQCTAEGASIPLRRQAEEHTLKRQCEQPEPSLKAIGTHLEDLTGRHDSLQVPLARALAREDAWAGLAIRGPLDFKFVSLHH